MVSGAPASCAVFSSAFTSFGRHDPPYPRPGKRSVLPILRSGPTPSRALSPPPPGADHHPLRAKEILDGESFPEEFRIGNHVELELPVQVLPDRRTQLLARPYGDRAFIDDHLVPD